MPVSATDGERGTVFMPISLASSVARARHGGIQLLFQHHPDEAAHPVATLHVEDMCFFGHTSRKFEQ
jgi:cysteinyl-tRNA synthetase